jgi:hypothetical protein
MSPTNAYKHLKISYVVNIVSLLHVHVWTTLSAFLGKVSYKEHITKTSRTNVNVT